MAEEAEEQREPDWEKARKVALALLLLAEPHRKDRLRVRPEISHPFLEAFAAQGWIQDSSTVLGWIEMTEAGRTQARAMLEKHFGIVVRERDRCNGD